VNRKFPTRLSLVPSFASPTRRAIQRRADFAASWVLPLALSMPTLPEWWTWDLSFSGYAEMRREQRGVPLEPGDRVRLIPNHSCVVSNLVDRAWLIDGHEAAAPEIAARGRIT